MEFGTSGGLDKSLSTIGVCYAMVVCFGSLTIKEFGIVGGLDRSLLCDGGMF